MARYPTYLLDKNSNGHCTYVTLFPMTNDMMQMDLIAGRQIAWFVHSEAFVHLARCWYATFISITPLHSFDTIEGYLVVIDVEVESLKICFPDAYQEFVIDASLAWFPNVIAYVFNLHNLHRFGHLQYLFCLPWNTSLDQMFVAPSQLAKCVFQPLHPYSWCLNKWGGYTTARLLQLLF